MTPKPKWPLNERRAADLLHENVHHMTQFHFILIFKKSLIHLIHFKFNLLVSFKV
jgi:hypothetical protein